jgi:uncharacterized membrane protein (DUF485 family)
VSIVRKALIFGPTYEIKAGIVGRPIEQKRRHRPMLHEPAVKTGPDPAFLYKRRLGAWMFILYALFYAGFVVINLVRPGAMETVLFSGLNMAVVYGFGLIIFALVLALIYSQACERREKRLRAAGGAPGGRT